MSHGSTCNTEPPGHLYFFNLFFFLVFRLSICSPDCFGTYSKILLPQSPKPQDCSFESLGPTNCFFLFFLFCFFEFSHFAFQIFQAGLQFLIHLPLLSRFQDIRTHVTFSCTNDGTQGLPYVTYATTRLWVFACVLRLNITMRPE